VLGEVATDDRFSQTMLAMRTGQPAALTLTNQGSAVHDWHLTDAKDANGQPINTKVVAPGQSATVVFTLATPGTYHFRCDVHPRIMQGFLVVM
jgi:plastocyanin